MTVAQARITRCVALPIRIVGDHESLRRLSLHDLGVELEIRHEVRSHFAPSFAILRCLQTLLGFDFVLPDRLKIYETALVAHPSVCNEYDDYVATLEKWAAAKCSET